MQVTMENMGVNLKIKHKMVVVDDSLSGPSNNLFEVFWVS